MIRTAFSFVLACCLLPAQTVSTQAVPTGPSNPPQNLTFVTPGLAMPGTAGSAVSVIAHEFSFNSGKPIAGAPYSADQVTEHVQTLADGNRIVNTTSTRIFRDSQGRTRTETTLPTLAGGPTPPVMITIQDPVAGVTYLLNSDNKTARRFAARLADPSATKALPLLPPSPSTTAGGPVLFTAASAFPKPDVKTEELGSQTLDGVLVTGTRTTETIPAGAIGNEEPIETASEWWFSPALQVVMKSTNTDPRIGKTTETLNNLNRAEPDPSLFQVPSDYTISDSRGGANTMIFRQQR